MSKRLLFNNVTESSGDIEIDRDYNYYVFDTSKAASSKLPDSFAFFLKSLMASFSKSSTVI